MPRIIPPAELDRLVELIGSQPDGMGMDAIVRQLGNDPQRRTLQRRLAQLVAQKRIDVLGAGRATHYRRVSAPEVAPESSAPWAIQEPPPDEITMSEAGASIRAHVSQPIHLRRPIGYRPEFLTQYHPNHSAYLPASLRAQLHEMGRSPAQHMAAGTFAQQMMGRLLIDLSWASSRLEGNTYSRLDTARLIEHGQAAEGKNAMETQMILNHKQAIEYLTLDPHGTAVNTETLIALHAFLSDGLMADPNTVGRIRRRPVGIGGSVYQPPAVPQQLEELLGLVVDMAAEIVDPFEQAFFLLVHLPYLQPFEDVNKRVSRLAANIPFIQHNLCPLSFIDVPQQTYIEAMLGVYELNRIELLRDLFVWAYARSCQYYVAVYPQLVPPDLFRLRHRQALGQAVAAIVKNAQTATATEILRHVPASVPAEDHGRFVQLVLTEFQSLHAGNAVRFGIRPLEWTAWQRNGSNL